MAAAYPLIIHSGYKLCALAFHSGSSYTYKDGECLLKMVHDSNKEHWDAVRLSYTCSKSHLTLLLLKDARFARPTAPTLAAPGLLERLRDGRVLPGAARQPLGGAPHVRVDIRCRRSGRRIAGRRAAEAQSARLPAARSSLDRHGVHHRPLPTRLYAHVRQHSAPHQLQK